MNKNNVLKLMLINNKDKPQNQMSMKVQSQKRHQDTEKSERYKNIADNHKILKKAFF